MNLAATYEGKELAKRTFTVSTWPYDFQTTLDAENLGFGLQVDTTWKSESGQTSDLTTVRMREYIEYTTYGSNPPFNNPPEPPSYSFPPGGYDATLGTMVDTYSYPKSYVDWSTQTPGSKVAAQQYQFWDFVLCTAWEDGVLGTGTITREVASFPGGSYVFVTTKDGTGDFSDTCQEAP
jgi:hypothetical protein